MDNDEVIKKAEQDLSLAGEMGYKTCIQELEEENARLRAEKEKGKRI